MKDYPNEKALYNSHRKYLDAMREFIFSYLEKMAPGEAEELIGLALNRQPSDDVMAAIDFGDIPRIFVEYWDDFFKQRFGYNKQRNSEGYDIRSVTRLISECRNRGWGHPGVGDLDPEFTRACLFLITDVLEEIGTLDTKREVEDIRDRLFFHEDEEHIAGVSEQLEAARAENVELEKQVKTTSDRLEEVEAERIACEERLATISFQLKMAVAGKTTAEERLSDISNQLEDAEVEKTQLEKRLKTVSDRLEEAEAELTACKEDLARTLRQLEGTEEGHTEYPSAEERLARALTESEKEEAEEERVEIAKQVAELRLNPDASKKMSWKNIREEVLLTSDEFHKDIRISDYYKEVMLDRLGSLIDEGWVYNGSLNILCGFDVSEEFVEKMESNKTKVKVAEAPSYRGDTAKSPKYQRKWRRPGAVAALRDPAEIQEAEAKIAKILNPSEKTRLERELREAKRGVQFCT